MSDAEVRAIQRYSPQVYFACHAAQARKGSTEYALASHDSGILTHLSEDVPTTPSRLIRHVGVAASTFSPQLERLVRLGYVQRVRAGENRRCWEIRPTPKGAKAMAATSVLEASRLKRVLARLSPDGRRRAVEGLALLAEASRRAVRRRP